MSATAQLSLFDTAEYKQKRTPVLQDALACLESIPHLNHGGCGISALAISRWASKHGFEIGDRPFVVLCDDEWDVNACNSHLENDDLDNAWFSHLAIEIDGTLYDSNGEVTEWLRCPYQLSEDELLYALNKISGWNSDFQRERNVPIIEIGLDVDLSDVNVHWR